MNPLPTKAEIEEKLKEIFRAKLSWGDREKFEVKWDGVNLQFTASQMYEHFELTFADLEQISQICGTDSINVDEDCASWGCDSCNYGSRYETTFTIRNVVCSE